MDITCPKCKTEYEFDDSKITEAGVTVKCTSCDYMFKVRRKAVVETEPITLPAPSALPPPSHPHSAAHPHAPPHAHPAPPHPHAAPPEPPGSKPWLIRAAAGQLFKFKELTTLQQWIVERKVSRDDHISKSGETWKRLGDIAELSSFFQVVDAAMAGEAMQHPAPTAPPRAQTPLPGPLPAASAGEPSGPSEMDEPAFAAGNARFQPIGPSAAWEEGGGRISGRHAQVDLSDELPRRGTGKLIGFVVVGAVLAIVAVLAVMNRHRLRGIFSGGEQNDAAFQTGRKLMLQDDEESLRLADQQLAKASQQSGLVLAARAEVFTTWTQHLRDQAELLDRRAHLLEAAGPSEEAKSQRLQSSRLKDDAEKKLSQAELFAKKGLELDPSKGEVKRAMADCLRLQARPANDVLPVLTDARKKLPEDPEALYVEGAYWASQGNISRAEDLLKEALTKTRARFGQSLIRAAFQLAMIHLRSGRRADARAQAESILQANDRHRWARELFDLIAAEDKPGVARPATPDAGVAKVPPGGTPPGGTPPDKTPPGKTPGGTSVAGSGGSYESLIKEGNALSEKGRTMQAFKLFERALKLKPAGVEALTGLGYCHLDQERFAAALATFKKALTIAPTNGEATIGMAEAYKVQGNNARALDYYRAYLQALPGGSKAVLAKRNVADLERKVAPPTPTPPETKTDPKPEPKPDPKPDPKPEPKTPPADIPEKKVPSVP